MTTHWIIAIGRPKLPVMSGNAMLTAVSSGTTEMPSPIRTSRTSGSRVTGAVVSAARDCFASLAMTGLGMDPATMSHARRR